MSKLFLKMPLDLLRARIPGVTRVDKEVFRYVVLQIEELNGPHVTLTRMAHELGISPKQARNSLRKVISRLEEFTRSSGKDFPVSLEEFSSYSGRVFLTLWKSFPDNKERLKKTRRQKDVGQSVEDETKTLIKSPPLVDREKSQDRQTSTSDPSKFSTERDDDGRLVINYHGRRFEW